MYRSLKGRGASPFRQKVRRDLQGFKSPPFVIPAGHRTRLCEMQRTALEDTAPNSGSLIVPARPCMADHCIPLAISHVLVGCCLLDS